MNAFKESQITKISSIILLSLIVYVHAEHLYSSYVFKSYHLLKKQGTLL